MGSHQGFTASQAWSILKRHGKDEIEPLHLQDLCRDDDRVSSLVAVYNTTSEVIASTTTDHPEEKEDRILIADLSRQRMTLDTLNHLLKLATARNLKKFITQLAWGRDPKHVIVPARLRNNNAKAGKNARFGDMHSSRPVTNCFEQTPIQMMPSMHMAFRVPAEKGNEMLAQDGTNILAGIHRTWDRLERLSDCIRRGQLRGVGGSMIRDVILVGRGVPVAALKFVYQALIKDERAVLASRFGLVEAASTRIRRNLVGAGTTAPVAARRLHFLTSVDPVAAADMVADLDPGSTLVISFALNGNEETGRATKTLKSWLLQALGTNRRADHVLAKHMLLVTGNDRIVSVINKPESVHIVPEHSRCEPFTTFSAAGLLPLSIVFGWPLVREFINGAHDIDCHFVQTNPRHNLPVLLALTDIWNDVFLGSSSRIVMPFAQCLEAYPAFVAALESQTCSRGADRRALPVKLSFSSTIIDGGLDHSFDRAFYQSSAVMNSELISVMDQQIKFNASRSIGAGGMDDVYSTQDNLICSLFAHADELAFGFNKGQVDPATPQLPVTESDVSEGNRPSALLILGKLDAFACGQLIALAEHRAVVKAHLWGLDPFVTETGSSLRMYRTDMLKDCLDELMTQPVEDEEEREGDDRMTLSTKTILGHYANKVRDERMYTVKGSYTF